MADAHDAHIHNYCPYTPFMYAFVILILQWVMFPIIFCFECMLICAVSACCAGCTVSACCAGATAVSAAYSAAATSDPSATVTTSSA